MREAFTFLVATAWTELFNDIFSMIVGEKTNIFIRFLHALAFTVLAVVFTVLFDTDDKTMND